MHAILIGNGEKLSARFIKKWAKGADILAAADGGAVQLARAGLTPDVVIGDLDSLPVALRKQLNPVSVILQETQQNNDLEKALTYLAQKGITSCTLIGFTGGRWDFSFGNLLLLSRFAKKMKLMLAGEEWQFYVLTAGRRFTCSKGARASLLPLTACRGVSLKGFVYPLQGASLPVGTTRTLSNQTTARQVEVSLKKGVLGVYFETKRGFVF